MSLMPPIPNSAKAARTDTISQLQICFVNLLQSQNISSGSHSPVSLFCPAFFNMVSLIFQNILRTGHRDPGSLFPNLRSTDTSLEHRTQLPHLPYGTAPFPDISCFPDNTLPGPLSPALVSSVSYPVHFVFLPVKFFLVHKWPPSLLQFFESF